MVFIEIFNHDFHVILYQSQSTLLIVFLDFPGLGPIPGFQLLYQLSRHSSLEKVVHLFPENSLIGGDDIVPGVQEGPPDGG
jgi:hypothetical protein